MIRIAKTEDFPLVQSIAQHVPCFGASVLADWALAAHNPAVDFQCYLIPGNALLTLNGHSAVVCGMPEFEDELVSLLSFLSVSSLFTDTWIPGGWHADSLLRLQWQAKQSTCTFFDARIEELSSASEVLAVLESSALISPSSVRDSYYSDLCAKRNYGLAGMWGIREEGTLVSVLTADGITLHEARITAVETRPQSRGRGYASALIKQFCSRHHEQTITLLCKPELFQFYHPLGFSPLGKVFLAKKPTTNLLYETDVET